MRKEHPASILPSQSDDFVVEYVEGKTLSQVSSKVRLKEVMSPLEEVPGMVKLGAAQLGELVFLILGAENVVDSGCCENGSRANRSSNELAVLVNDRIEDGTAGDSHVVCNMTGGIQSSVTLTLRTERCLHPAAPGTAHQCQLVRL